MINAYFKGGHGYGPFVGTISDEFTRMEAVDQRGELTAITAEDGEIVIVSHRLITEFDQVEAARIRNARLYRAEWAGKTGSTESQVYIPEAIRPLTAKVY